MLVPAIGTRPPMGINARGYGASGSAGVAPDTRFFGALDGDSGNANLSDVLTINSLAGTQLFGFRGEDVSGSTWTAAVGGANLTLTGSGSSPTTAFGPSTTSSERIQTFAAGKYFQAASATLGNLGTDDAVIEIFYKSGDTSSTLIGNKNTTGTTGAGWNLRSVSSAASQFFLRTSAGTVTLTLGAAPGAWSHLLVFVDRNEASTNGCHAYINGALGTSADPSALVATNINAGAGAFTIGALTDGTTPSSGSIAFARAWSRPAGWFAGGATNATQWAAVAKERSARLFGFYASKSTGNLPVPSTMTRNTDAYLDRVVSTSPTVRQIFRVNTNAPRLCRRESLSGGTFLTGALMEAASTNGLLRSEEFDNATWTKVLGSVTANATASPEATTTADAFVADATTGTHGVTQASSLAASTYVFSVWCKAGDKSLVALSNNTIANGTAWFDLGAGALGTKQAGVAEAIIDPWGNGWFRCSIRFVGTVASHTLAVSCASADASLSSTGDAATVSTYVWGAQLETVSFGPPTSYIATTNGSAAHNLDTLDYDITSSFPAIGAAFSVSLDILARSYDLLNAANPLWISAASGSNANSVYPSIIAAGDLASLNLFTASVNQVGGSGGSDVINGEKHTLLIEAATNAATLKVDGTTVVTDTSVTLPASAMVYLRVGSGSASSGMAGMLVGNVAVR